MVELGTAQAVALRTAGGAVPATHTRVQRLLERAHRVRTLALAWGYPFPGRARQVRAMFARATRPTAAGLARAWARAEHAWRAADDDSLAAAYARLFIGAHACPLHETAYGDGRRIAGRTAELADIAGFYRAFGFELAPQDAVPPDHVCAELEFYSAMLLKAAWAGRGGWSERGRIVVQALRRFLKDHLGRWPVALAREIAAQRAPSPYGALSALLAALIAHEARAWRVLPQPLVGVATGDAMQQDSFACPHAPALDSVCPP